MEDKIVKWIKIISALTIMCVCIWQANERFSMRDPDSGALMALAAVAFGIAALAFYFKKNKR